MTKSTVYKSPPTRLLLTGDRKIGIVIVYIANGGAKTTLFEIEAIKNYAKTQGKPWEEVFAELLGILYYVSRISDSGDPDISDAEKKFLASDAGKEKVKEESEKIAADFINGKSFCMTDFSFLTTPGEGDVGIGRYSIFTDILQKALVQVAVTPEEGRPDPLLGPVIRGVVGDDEP